MESCEHADEESKLYEITAARILSSLSGLDPYSRQRVMNDFLEQTKTLREKRKYSPGGLITRLKARLCT